MQLQPQFLGPLLGDRDASLGGVEPPHVPSETCQVDGVSPLSHPVVEGHARLPTSYDFYEEGVRVMVEIGITVEIEAAVIIGIQSGTLRSNQPDSPGNLRVGNTVDLQLGRVSF